MGNNKPGAIIKTLLMKAELSTRCFIHTQVSRVPCVKSCQPNMTAIATVRIIIFISTVNSPSISPLPARMWMQRDWALRADIWALQTAAHTQSTPQRTVFQRSLIRKVDLCVRVRVFVAKLWGGNGFFSSSSKRGHGKRMEQNEEKPYWIRMEKQVPFWEG